MSIWYQKGFAAPIVLFVIAAAIFLGMTFFGGNKPANVLFPGSNRSGLAPEGSPFDNLSKNPPFKKTQSPAPVPRTPSPFPSSVSNPSPGPSPSQSQATAQPTSTPTPTASPQPKTHPTCTPSQRDKFIVKPYLVYPADKPTYPEYETAVRNYITELQNWYCEKVGVTFPVSSLQVVRSSYNYQTMRCGENPSQACLDDPKKLEGNWGMYMNKAIHGGIERWDEETAALIFSAGGGGYAGANVYSNYAGFGITGDWVLEPITGRANDWGIPCKYSDGWQCAGGVPKGSPAHELGHAFGLPHPDNYSGDSIMKWHGGYPGVGFLPHEIENLRQSPFFK